MTPYSQANRVYILLNDFRCKNHAKIIISKYPVIAGKDDSMPNFPPVSKVESEFNV